LNSFVWLTWIGRIDEHRWPALNQTFVVVSSWPGRANAEFELAAVKQSSKAGQQGKFCADQQGPLMADKNRPADGFDGQVSVTEQPFERR
jgi:hypothetical protein